MYKNRIKISEIIIQKYYSLIRDTEHTHIILTSGRAGTKSSFMAILTSLKIISDPECSAVILRKYHNKLKKTVYKEILRGIKRLGLDKKKHFKTTVSPMEIKYKKNGNTIYFTGNDSIDDTKGMIDESKPIKLVVLDELTEFFDGGEGEEELANIEATFIRGNNQNDFKMIYLFNPPKNPNAPIMKWLEKMKKRSDVLHIHVTYQDVPESWLGKALIKSAAAMAEVDPKMYEWVWLGKCIGVDELIYYMFSQSCIYSQIPEEEKKIIGEIGIGVDYGQKNPTTFQAFGIDWVHRCLRGLDEYYHCGRDEGQKSPSEYAKDFKAFCEQLEKEYNRRISWVFIDPSAKGLAEEIKRLMPDISIRDADNTVTLGIGRVQKMLSFGKLLISEKQKHLIEEMGLYQYDDKSIEKGKEVPLKINDHCVTGDTLIDTIHGKIPIENLVGKKGKVFCYDAKRKKKTVSEFCKVRLTQKEAPVYTIALKDGTTIKATAEHRVMTERGWMRVKDLSIGDKILRIDT